MFVSYNGGLELIPIYIGPGGIEPPYYNYRLYALPLSYDPTNIIFLYIHISRHNSYRTLVSYTPPVL